MSRLYYDGETGQYYQKVYTRQYKINHQIEMRLMKNLDRPCRGPARDRFQHQLQCARVRKRAGILLLEVERAEWPPDTKVVPIYEKEGQELTRCPLTD